MKSAAGVGYVARQWPSAQDGGEIAGGGAPGGGGVGGGAGEAAVIVGEEFGEAGIGGIEGGDAAQAQLADEAVLQSLPETLDAPLGLGGVGADEADAELLQDAPEMGGVPAPRSCSSRVQWGSVRTKTLRRSP